MFFLYWNENKRIQLTIYNTMSIKESIKKRKKTFTSWSRYVVYFSRLLHFHGRRAIIVQGLKAKKHLRFFWQIWIFFLFRLCMRVCVRMHSGLTRFYELTYRLSHSYKDLFFVFHNSDKIQFSEVRQAYHMIVRACDKMSACFW